jgi:hypothetical protein
MQSIGVYPNQQLRFGLQSGVARKIIIGAIVVVALAYALYHLSTTHLVMLGLMSGMVLMFVYRIGTINSMHANPPKHSTVTGCSDGGTFSHKHQTHTKSNARPIVHDGGSHERPASLKKKY